jgi:nitrite reductase (NADH) small subunit
MHTANSSHPAERSAWMPVARIDQLSVGQGRCFLAGRHRIALFRLRSGEVYAVDAACPHRGGPLAEGLAGCATVICPLHGYRFSLADGRGIDNDLEVTTYAAEMRADRIYVRLPV